MPLITFFSNDVEVEIDSWTDLPSRFKARLEERQLLPCHVIDPLNPTSPFPGIVESFTSETVPMLGEKVDDSQMVALVSSQASVTKKSDQYGEIITFQVHFSQYQKYFKANTDGLFQLKTPGKLLILEKNEWIEETGQEDKLGIPTSLFFIGDEEINHLIFTWSERQRLDFLI